jgi:holo-[acyl-carrier-protein] synthase
VVGIDIVEVGRIKGIISKKGARFLYKILSEEEINYVSRKKRFVESVSGIFAAKEAFMKAMEKRLPFKKIRVFHQNGKPYIIYENKKYGDVSISHEKNYAVSVVIIP